MFTLSEARLNAKPILQGLTDADLLVVINELLVERQQLAGQQTEVLKHASAEQKQLQQGGPSVAGGRALYDARHGRKVAGQ